MPYQPDGVWGDLNAPPSHREFYVQSKGDNLYRKSLYTYWRRAVLHPSMSTFDAPSRDVCAPSNGHPPILPFKLWLLCMTPPIGKPHARSPFSFTGKQIRLNRLLKECFQESLPPKSSSSFQICKISAYLITEKIQNLPIALYPWEKVRHPARRWNLLNWLGLLMSATHFSISARP